MAQTPVAVKLPNDPLVQHRFATLNNIRYHYLFAEPKSVPEATVFLIHGWPELSAAWRYQIPALVQRGCRVVAPDMMGFGRTEAPQDLKKYTFKTAADDIAELARHLGIEKIILGGHDWGGFVVYRTCLWYPELVSHVFSVVTPYKPPARTYTSLEDLVSAVPPLAYQLQLVSGLVEKEIHTRDQICQFLQGMFGATTTDGELPFSLFNGINFKLLPKLGDPKLLTLDELGYYTDEFTRNGLRGTLNWYRTRKLNYDDELELQNPDIGIPVLFIQSTKRNPAVAAAQSAEMESHLAQLTTRQVDTGHWALVEAPAQVNAFILDWIKENTI